MIYDNFGANRPLSNSFLYKLYAFVLFILSSRVASHHEIGEEDDASVAAPYDCVLRPSHHDDVYDDDDDDDGVVAHCVW